MKIIPTTHLIPKEEIYKLLSDNKPEVIAVELCVTRYELMVRPLLDNYLDEKPKDDSLLGKISNSIKKKAKEENIQYGSDQINACLYAKENNIDLEFVDLDITKTKELLEIIPKEEQEGFLKELAEFEKKTLKEQAENIDEEKILIELKKRFPIAFEFLVNYRNLVIINNLLKLERKYPDKKIVCLLGKCHTKIIEGALNG